MSGFVRTRLESEEWQRLKKCSALKSASRSSSFADGRAKWRSKSSHALWNNAARSAALELLILLALSILLVPTPFLPEVVPAIAAAPVTPYTVNVSIPYGAYIPNSSAGYQPDVITVTIGINNTVTWTNHDIVVHTVTSDTGAFNSGNLAPNQSWTYTFTQPGVYYYKCIYHYWMHGEVIVNSPSGKVNQTSPTIGTINQSNTVVVQNYQSSSIPAGPSNPPGFVLVAAVFVLLIAGFGLGEISARRTR